MQTHEYQDMFESEDRLWWYAGLRLLLDDALKDLNRAELEPIILDAGSGTGKNLSHVRGKGYSRAFGVELSPHGLSFSTERGLAGLIPQASITHLPFPDASFHLVYCMDVLYMLTETKRKQAVSEFLRVLKPGGRLLVHDAALEGLRSLHDEVVMTQKRFTLAEHDAMFQGFGLRKLRSSYRVTLLFPLVAGAKWLKRLAAKVIPGLKMQASDQGVPAAPINSLLTAVMRLEHALNRQIRFPFGSSVYYYGEKGA